MWSCDLGIPSWCGTLYVARSHFVRVCHVIGEHPLCVTFCISQITRSHFMQVSHVIGVHPFCVTFCVYMPSGYFQITFHVSFSCDPAVWEHPLDVIKSIRSCYCNNNVYVCKQLRPDQSAFKQYDQCPVFQSIVSLTSLLVTNSLTAVAKVFSNTLIFLLKKCE